MDHRASSSTSFEASATAGASACGAGRGHRLRGDGGRPALSASSLQAASFSVPAIIGFRLLALAAFAALLAYALVP